MLESFPQPKPQSSPEKKNPSVNLRRRDILRGLAYGAVGAGIGILTDKTVTDVRAGKRLDDFVDDAREVLEGVRIKKEITEITERVRAMYGVEVALEDNDLEEVGGKHYAFVELRLLRQREALEVLEYGLSLYPRSVITQSGLKIIAITARLQRSEIGGYATLGHLEAEKKYDQSKIALAYTNQWGHAEYIGSGVQPKKEVESRVKVHNTNFLRTLDHELCHFFIDTPGSERSPRLEEARLVEQWDEAFGEHNQVARRENEAKAWTGKYNPMTGDKELDYARIGLDIDGFARGYGITNSLEDRATVVEFMTEPSLSRYGRIEDDKVLAKKMDMLQDYYFRLSRGLMDRRYWLRRSRDDIQNMHKGFYDRPIVQYFKLQAATIITTPYSDLKEKHLVSEEEYKLWQRQLKQEYFPQKP